MKPAERYDRFLQALANLCDDYEVALAWEDDRDCGPQLKLVEAPKPSWMLRFEALLENELKETKP